jgi:hypothetical protein
VCTTGLSGLGPFGMLKCGPKCKGFARFRTLGVPHFRPIYIVAQQSTMWQLLSQQGACLIRDGLWQRLGEDPT